MSNEEKMNKARLTSKLKKDLLDGFFESKQQDLLAQFLSVEIGNKEQLVNIHTQCRALMDLQVEIKKVVDSGIIAKTML